MSARMSWLSRASKSAMLVAAFAMVVSSQANAAFITSFINWSKDIGTGSFGTVTISDVGQPTGTLLFTIAVVDPPFGVDRDIHQFGFNIDSSATLLTVAKVTPGNYTPVLSAEGVSNFGGIGKNPFDYMVDFGPGGDPIEPIEFKLSGTGLDIDDFLPTDLVEIKNGYFGNFGVHVQQIDINGGSILLGGQYGGVSNTPTVPEPFTAGLMLSGMALSGFVLRRRRK